MLSLLGGLALGGRGRHTSNSVVAVRLGSWEALVGISQLCLGESGRKPKELPFEIILEG